MYCFAVCKVHYLLFIQVNKKDYFTLQREDKRNKLQYFVFFVWEIKKKTFHLQFVKNFFFAKQKNEVLNLEQIVSHEYSESLHPFWQYHKYLLIET